MGFLLWFLLSSPFDVVLYFTSGKQVYYCIRDWSLITERGGGGYKTGGGGACEVLPLRKGVAEKV